MARKRSFERLKEQLEALFVPELKITFNRTTKKMKSRGEYFEMPRFFLKAGNYVLWDCPKNFNIENFDKLTWSEHNGINALLKEYVNLPAKDILDHTFIREHIIVPCVDSAFEIDYNLIKWLIVADRRISVEKLWLWAGKQQENLDVFPILARRFADRPRKKH